MSTSVDRADGGGDQRRLRHRRDVRRASPRAARTITVRFVLERDINDAANDVREKVAGAMRERAAGAAAAGHHQGRSRRRSGDVADRVVRRDEPADADRDRRQADRARDPDGQRRRRGRPRRRPRPRDPHRRRHREAELVRPVDRRRCATRSSPRTSRSRAARSSRARASCCCARSAASTPPTDFNNIVVATKNGTPIRVVRHRLRRGQRSSGRRSAVWLGDTPAVMLDIRRAMGENTVAVIEGVRAKLATDSSGRCRRRSS